MSILQDAGCVRNAYRCFRGKACKITLNIQYSLLSLTCNQWGQVDFEIYMYVSRFSKAVGGQTVDHLYLTCGQHGVIKHIVVSGIRENCK